MTRKEYCKYRLSCRLGAIAVTLALWCLLVGAVKALAKDAQVTITDQEQQELFKLDGAFDACMKSGGQRCVIIQDWLKAKLAAEKEKTGVEKKPEPKNE